jgi:hypothetical protein
MAERALAAQVVGGAAEGDRLRVLEIDHADLARLAANASAAGLALDGLEPPLLDGAVGRARIPGRVGDSGESDLDDAAAPVEPSRRAKGATAPDAKAAPAAPAAPESVAAKDQSKLEAEGGRAKESADPTDHAGTGSAPSETATRRILVVLWERP